MGPFHRRRPVSNAERRHTSDRPVGAREGEGWHRRTEVIALGFAVAEKAFGHHTADAVLSEIGNIRPTETIAKPSGHRFASAELEGRAENVQIAVLIFVLGR